MIQVPFQCLQTFHSSAPDKAHGVQYDRRVINSFLGVGVASLSGHERGDDLAPGVTLSLG